MTTQKQLVFYVLKLEICISSLRLSHLFVKLQSVNEKSLEFSNSETTSI